ncbi:MAG: tyrosine-type recombinase/integrase [Clostridia bacterium]|nr:tyrosine-type recombinase/integrase [Clostridia bacterium]
MSNDNNYFLQRKVKVLSKIDEILKKLPHFVTEYFVGIENNSSPLTRLNYAVDLQIFFDYVLNKYDYESVTSIPLSVLDKMTASDIEHFLSYLSSFEYNGKHHVCNEKAKARKLASIRSLYKYFFNKDKIIANVASKVATPKIHDKEIIRLENSEVSELLNTAETGKGLTKHQLAYSKNTQIRDIALLTLFLGTGIRISELVGLNIDDFFFDTNSFVITRKGGNRTILYFTDEVKNELLKWLEYRKTLEKVDKNEKAMFLSLRNKRISVRAVEELVKKYAKVVTPLKRITPHKLRSTFGTNLYRQTGDIYIVADYLGHKDINTTKRHYAAISDDMRKSAIQTLKLKDE